MNRQNYQRKVFVHTYLKQNETKLRVVLDGYSKSETSILLIDINGVSPVGGVEKMYRQIEVNPNNVDFQRMFCRENPNSKNSRVSPSHGHL